MVEKRSALLTLVLLVLITGSLRVPASASDDFAPGSGSLGVCTHSLTKEEADLVRLGGLKWVRADVAEILGEYSFAEVVANAKERGIKVLGILDIWTMRWKWDFSLAEWENVVKASVIRYREGVQAWEIWNEPEYPSNPLTPERYHAMLRAAYSTIKQYDPDAKVIMGGGLHLNTGGDPWLARDKTFAERLFQLGAEQYADGISFHAYPWTSEVTDWVWARYGESLDFYASLSGKRLELWITETGHPAQFEGEEGQARYLAEASSFFKERGAEVVFWYELRDIPKWTTESPTFGLFTETLTARSAFFSLPTTFIGVNYISASHLYDTPDNILNRDFTRFRSDGINTIAVAVHWYRVETDRGVYNQSFIDNVIRVANIAAAHGIRVMIDFRTSTGADDAWSNPEYVGAGRNLLAKPDIASAYLAMIKWTVARVRAVSNVRTYSILNEPNYLPLDESGRRGWVNLIADASNAVRELDKRPVTARLAQEFFDTDWVWDSGLLDAIDFISLNMHSGDGTSDSNSSTAFAEYGARLADIAESAALLKKQVVVAEFGYESSNSTLQAEMYQAYLEAFRSTSNLMGWLSWNWNTGYYPANDLSVEPDYYSLVDMATGAPRPAYYVLAQTAS